MAQASVPHALHFATTHHLHMAPMFYRHFLWNLNWKNRNLRARSVVGLWDILRARLLTNETHCQPHGNLTLTSPQSSQMKDQIRLLSLDRGPSSRRFCRS